MWVSTNQPITLVEEIRDQIRSTSRHEVRVTPWGVWRVAYCTVPSRTNMYNREQAKMYVHSATNDKENLGRQGSVSHSLHLL